MTKCSVNNQSRVIDVPQTTQLHITSSEFTTEDAVRFWRKVNRGRGRDACWTWTGSTLGRDGYGAFSVARGKARGQQPPRYAHRVAYMLVHGPILAGLSVLHRCDNPPCVNPTHLFLGTQRDNMRDAANKGRLHVERPRRQRLTTAQLIEVDALYASGWPQVRIAERFGVTPSWVSLYLRGERRQLSVKQAS